jgi:hypothetical protein
MKRFTTRLPDELHKRLSQEAIRNGISLAELIRRRLEPRNRGKRQNRPVRDPLDEVVGTISSGRLSEGIDEELYGEFDQPRYR